MQANATKLTVVVTGASGYIGSAFVRHLLNQGGYSLRQVTHTDPNRLLSGRDLSAYQVKDFSNASEWRDVLRGADIVVHLAGRAHKLKEYAVGSAKKYYQSNVQPTKVLGEMAAKYGVRRFVFVSTVGVNGNRTNKNTQFVESDPPRPHNSYAQSKWMAEQLLMNLAKNTGMEVVIVRPPLVYGAGAPGNFGLLKRAVLCSWPMPFAAVDNRRSIVALDNLIDLLTICLTHPNAANQTFLVSDGQDISTPNLIREMSLAVGIPSRIIQFPIWALRMAGFLFGRTVAVQGLCDNLQVDISKVHNMLGWNPSVTHVEGIRRAMLN